MAKCKNCIYNKIMAEFGTNKPLSYYYWCVVHNDCLDVEEERECDYYEAVSRAYRIRNMTDEELANLLCVWNDEYGEYYGIGFDSMVVTRSGQKEDVVPELLEWLQSPVEV